jgi:hypothetical protein
VQEPDTPDEHFPPTGRHGAPPLDLRRTVFRLSVGAGTLMVVAALAVLTAFWTGLTDATPSDVQQVQAPRQSTVSASPTFARTLDLDVTRADRSAQQSATEAPESVAESSDRALAAGTAPAPPPEPAPAPPLTAAPSPVAQPGDPCSTEGARGTTAGGKPVRCSARGGEGETRWRPA